MRLPGQGARITFGGKDNSVLAETAFAPCQPPPQHRQFCGASSLPVLTAHSLLFFLSLYISSLISSLCLSPSLSAPSPAFVCQAPASPSFSGADNLLRSLAPRSGDYCPGYQSDSISPFKMTCTGLSLEPLDASSESQTLS